MVYRDGSVVQRLIRPGRRVAIVAAMPVAIVAAMPVGLLVGTGAASAKAHDPVSNYSRDATG